MKELQQRSLYIDEEAMKVSRLDLASNLITSFPFTSYCLLMDSSESARERLAQIAKDQGSTIGKEAGCILDNAILSEGIGARLGNIEAMLSEVLTTPAPWTAQSC